MSETVRQNRDCTACGHDHARHVADRFCTDCSCQRYRDPLARKRPTAEEIEAAKTPAGGWTREQLEEWGVPWPPTKGWKRRIGQ